MHCVFEGVVKKLGELWFNPKYVSEIFNISNLVDVLDEKLCVLKLSSFVARRPRPIKTHFSYWKASELKNWFFYMSVPALYNILPSEYFEHYKLLVLAVYILCKQNITNEMINFAETLITEFLLRFETLYNIKYMTCNVHSLSHLTNIVRRLGPLWTTSCLPLEDIGQ